MRDFGRIHTIVIKVGTNLLSSKEGVDRNRVRDIARQISKLLLTRKQAVC